MMVTGVCIQTYNSGEDNPKILFEDGKKLNNFLKYLTKFSMGIINV